MFYGHICAHGRLNGPRDFHSSGGSRIFWVGVVCIQGLSNYLRQKVPVSGGQGRESPPFSVEEKWKSDNTDC